MTITKARKAVKTRAAAKKPRAPQKTGAERRRSTRYRVKMQVDYSSGENFLFSYIDNISDMGIFISSSNPLRPGTSLTLRFTPQGSIRPFEIKGRVVWNNPYHKNGENLNPGMGVRFVGVTEEQKKKLQEVIKTIAYIHENWI